MAGLFSLLFFLALFALIGGMIKPSWVIRWGESNKTRKHVLKYYGLTLLATFILFGIFFSDRPDPLKKRFTNKRDAVIASIETELDSGRYSTVLDSTKRYLGIAPKDSALLSLHQAAEKETLRMRLQDVPGSNYKQNLDIYERLTELDTSNQAFKEKRDFYSQKIAEKKARLEKEKARRKQEKRRKEKIERQFSGWDGSNRPVTRAIKRRLKDPDSYEHIETRYGDQGSHILIITRFRAKNSFGGYAVHRAVAKTSIGGDVLSLEIE